MKKLILIIAIVLLTYSCESFLFNEKKETLAYNALTSGVLGQKDVIVFNEGEITFYYQQEKIKRIEISMLDNAILSYTVDSLSGGRVLSGGRIYHIYASNIADGQKARILFDEFGNNNFTLSIYSENSESPFATLFNILSYTPEDLMGHSIIIASTEEVFHIRRHTDALRFLAYLARLYVEVPY